MTSVLVCRGDDGLDALAGAFADPTREVDRAEDGYRAIEVAARTRPLAAFVQGGVAGPAGAELVRRLRQASPDTRLVFLLPEESSEEAAELLGAGADGILGPDPAPDMLRWAFAEVARGGCVIAPGTARTLVARFADVAQRERQWSKSLAEVSRQAEQLTKAKGEFLSNVSHELRTPLTIIKGMAQVVAKFGEDEKQAAMMGKLDEAATKLTRMVENLLVLAEMERGELSLDIADCDVAVLVREAAREAGARYPEVSIELNVPESIPAKLDADRIQEVVRHLVDNACRYSEDGDEVTVQAKLAPEGIRITVVDRGRGLDRKVIAAAFGEAFSPGEEVMTKDRAGLGLGLNLARNLVILHGGILSADPMPGGGSKVSVVLPPEPGKEEPAAPDAGTEDDDPLAMLRQLQQRLAESESRA